MKPILLLIPGMLNDERVWSEVTTALVSEVDVRVASVARQDSLSAMADDAWGQLAEAPQQAAVFVAGFSMGGYVAIEMMARPRRSLSGAALLSTSARPESEDGLSARGKTIAALQGAFEKTVAGIAKWGTHEARPNLIERLTGMMMDVGAETAVRQTRAIMRRTDHREALARTSYPMVVMCGSHDRVTPPDLSRELAALAPKARLLLVDGAGHMLPCEQPAAVVSALRSLINSQ